MSPNSFFAQRLAEVTPSLTLSLDAKAKALKAAGADVCSFTVGEPDFDTPEHIKNAAKKALDAGKTKYGNTAGELKLREEIVKKLSQDNSLTYSPEQIIVSNGGKHSIFNVILALVNPGDEVLIPAPYWLSYPEMVRLAGGIPVIIPTTAHTNYKISPDQLRAAINPRTKLFLLNSPSNPTGMVYNKEELTEIANVICEKNIFVLSDEIYEKLVYENTKHISIASLNPEIFKRTIVCNGFAKAYAMTGWRIGYVAANTEIVKSLINLQSHSTSNICSFAQYGAIAALEGPQTSIESMRKTFAERLELAYKLASKIPGISCVKPLGAFYLFLNIEKLGINSFTFCQDLLHKENVATIPGVVFGDDSHIRLSYATDFATIQKGFERMAKFIGEIS